MKKKDEMAAALKGEGCLGKAADDEPVFILRAQDVLAGDVVRFWADILEMRHHSQGTKTAAVKAKISEARGLARQMDEWPIHKLAD